MSAIVAVDIGAESGRVMRGRAGSDELEELHRFANGARAVGSTLRWDLDALWDGICTGLAEAFRRGPVASIGIDTWGVDYVLVDAANAPLEQPWCYRDARTEGAVAAVDAVMPRRERFRRTGVQALPFNTLYQLHAHQRSDPAIFRRADKLLFVGDHLHRRLCGGGPARAEHSIAGSAELLRAGERAWDFKLATSIGIDGRVLPELVASGTVLGSLDAALARRLGAATPPRIITPPVHDTAAAASCVAEGAYLSCGTWSLLGCVLERPALDDAVLAAGLSNEVAADGRPRLNRNIIGLWIVQECRRHFAAQGGCGDYAALCALARQARPAPAILDVDDPGFFSPQGEPMPARIAAWYRARGLAVPAGEGETVRWVLEGLAAAYARALADLGRLAGRPLDSLTVVGGGVRNELLLELTRAACPVPVHAGPAEATALGNLRSQAGTR